MHTSFPSAPLRALTAAVTIPALAVLALTGCAPDSAGAPSVPTVAASTAAAAAAAASVHVEDAWVKATDGTMSAAFAEIHNIGDADVQLVSATASVGSEVELHQTSVDAAGNAVMGEIDGGFTIAAGSSRTFEPGGDHFMLMDLSEPLTAGDAVTLTLTFADASTVEVTAVVKDFAGANETYHEDH